INSNTVIACGEQGTIIKTTDGGINWTCIQSNTYQQLNSIYFVDSLIGYIGGYWVLLKTTDGGNNWQFLTDDYYIKKVYFLNANNGFILWPVGQAAFKTTDGGINWTTMYLPSSSYSMNSINFLDQTNGFLVGKYYYTDPISGNQYCRAALLETSDGGNSWSDITYQNIFNTCVYIDNDCNNCQFPYCEWSELSKCTELIDIIFDFGKTSRIIYSTNSPCYGSGSGGNASAYILNYNNWMWDIYKSDCSKIIYNGKNSLIGLKWDGIYYRGTAPDCNNTFIKKSSFIANSVHFADSLNGYYVGQNGFIGKTTDGGQNWIEISTNGQYNNSYYHDLVIINNYGWYITQISKSFKTTDGGNTWSTLNINGSAATFLNQDTGWVVSNNGIAYKTIDGGINWTQQIIGSNYYNNFLYDVVFYNDNIGWILSNDTIYKTMNSGINWTSYPLPTNNRKMFFFDMNVGFMFGSCLDPNVMYRTNNGGKNWVLNTINNECSKLSTVIKIAFSIENNNYYAYAYNNGSIYKTTFCPVGISTTTNIVGCTDTSANASINVTGLEAPYSYLWDMNTGNQTTQTAINLSTGRYFVTVTANNGCSIVDSVTAFQPNMMSSTDSCINNTWLQKADFGGTARSGAVGFSIDNKGYIGTGHDGSGYKRDFWEYNPGTNTWTQKADFGGKARSGAVGFSISNKGYIGTGQDNSDYKKDFWEYDPINNIWIQKADFGGTAREWAIGFSIGNKGYIGTGYPNLKDFWEYDPINNIWIQKADFGGTARWGAVGFSIGNKGYIGTGYQLNSPYYSKDFWEYNPDNNTWVQKTDFGGVSRNGAVGYSIENNGYIGTGYSTWGYYKDYWEYNPATNTWLQKADFGGTARNMAVGFSIGNKGYIGIGYDGSVKKDFWVYNRINEGFVLCSNDSNANATIFVNGGIPPYSYLWSTGDTSFTTNNLSSGQYQITITDNQGCIIYDTVNIYAPLPVTYTASAINPSCFNSSNGSITVTASGGTGTKQYSKNGGTTYQSSNIFNNLAADTYQIVVKDANNCISSAQSVTITQPDAITFSTTKTDITCNGSNNGTITVTASGGTGQLLYSNNNGSIYQSSNVFSNLTSGTYQIKVKDTNNCVTTAQSVTIINPSAITFTKTKTDITCNGYNDGTITVTASGGTGTLQYSNDNGNSYQSSNVFNGLSGGTYQIVIKDVNNCITTAQSVTIINPAAISFSTSKADVACYGNNTGSITVTANDGTGTLQYSKNNGSTYQSSNIFSSLAAGSYQIVVKDANNCVTSAQTVTITQPSAITFSVSKTDEFCNGNNDGTITVSASGGTGTLLYSKNNGSTYQSSNIFSNLSPGTYQVVVKDANNCVTSAQNITISTTNYEPVFTTHPASQTKCEGENVTFSIAATGTPTPAYQWKKDGYDIMGATGLSLTITGVTTGDAGSYTCTASNVCDTVTSNFAMFIVYTKPLIIQQPASQIKCNGQSVSFTVTATGTTPLLYQWKKDGVNINGATASTYSISSISSGVEGNYTCAISNLCDSILSDTATLTINTPPVITTQPQSQAKCTGDNVTFNVVSTGLNLMYQWKKNNSAISFANSASYTISNIAAGDFGFYTCDIVNPCGSITSDAATLSISTVPGQPGSIIGLNSVCENQSNLSYSINAVAGADSYTWSVPSVWSIISGLGTTAISVNAGTISGNVSVTAGNSCGSGIAQLLAVTVNTFPVATIIPQGDTTFCNGNTVILEANAEIGYTYLWFKDSVSLGVNTIQYTATET
ncbi:MAG: immunoglobulin domain-containing protein, partial [Bacteroidia bacterium]|nr:immunoglobulin domain-containing protein [Bacteroidia bacterium]